jgi:hypothetical protein
VETEDQRDPQEIRNNSFIERAIYMKIYKSPLNEITRWEILNRSKRQAPVRYKKKDGYKSFYTARDFTNIDFAKLFTNDTFVWKSRVGGYETIVSFEGAFANLYNKIGSWSGKNRWKRINLKLLTTCLSQALDEEDLYLSCTCDDFKYRFDYWLSMKYDAKYGPKQTTKPKVRNVNDNKGFVCKHLLSSLHGKKWVPAAAKAWLEFIRDNPELAEELIWG